MNNDASNLKYPEMLEYSWVKDMDRVKAQSKFVSSAGRGLQPASEMPKVPINLLLTVMKDAMTRPEVMAAYGSAPVDGQIPPRENHLLIWFNEYLRHKYGTVPDPVMWIGTPLRRLANGFYENLDDPNLILNLLARRAVTEDDGVDYEQ
ncbi:hypothetical protein [Pseudovibrio sp. Tun.PSC04-5.I4]|uniref:hypothetical protein n=1 Tax=Pseudovibrio sp. Tun.PSC04-5.I4 TaxID=1798213 RepID=UPI000892492D|nr:hypothetical protein [Pseudovibrio sp. Tun.PSC04-5.I4]SDR10713.1 hypothetical protein SAMN04515695_2800 [Pseudovibrio sp. Tun.PSC04-5.I4]